MGNTQFGKRETVKHATTTRLFWTFTGLSVLGIVLLIAGGALAGKSGTGVIGGSILGLIGAVAIIFAGIVELFTWIGALIHTARHERWGWFAVILLLTWTWVAMLAYVLAGPKDAAVPTYTPVQQ